MASKQNPPEDPGHTETEDETIAAKKKRSRRVSFADVEVTSVHIFNRDDDHSDSTPPSDPKPLDGIDSRVKSHEFDRTGHFAEVGVRSNDSPSAFDDKEEEGEVSAEGKSFFKPAETPSPGSSSADSSFSSDAEDNFFGPVSSGFIRPPRLSVSSASDENHDITMDSTSFSVHFRSLARSESDIGGDMKTPTRTHLVFEEKTPTPSISGTHPGSLMVLTNARKFGQESSVSLGSVESDGKDSNAMSLVGEDARSSDYERLSPSLDTIFAESSKDLQNVSPSHLPIHESGSTSECGGGKKDMKEAGSNEMDKTMPTEEVMKDSCGVDERSSDLSVHPHINSYKQPVEADKESTECADKMTGENIGVSDIIVGTPQSTTTRSLQHGSICHGGSDDRHLKENLLCDVYTSTDVGRSSDGVLHGSPLPGSISVSYVKMTETCSPAKFSTLTPVAMGGSKTLLSMESQHGLSFSSLQKSITRLKSLDRSSSPLKRGSEALKLRLRNFQSANSSHNTLRLESGIDVYGNRVDTPVAPFKHLSHDQKDIQNRHRSNLDNCESETPGGGIKTISNLSQNAVTATAVGNGECQEGGLFTSVSSCKDKPSEVTAMTSPFKYFDLQKEVMQLDLVSNNSPSDIPFITEAGPSVKNILNKMDVSETAANSSLYVSPAESLEGRSAEGKDNQSHKGGDVKQHPDFSKFTTSAVFEQNQTSPETAAISGGCLIYNVGDTHSFSPESMKSPKGSPFEKLPVDIIEYSRGEASVSPPSQNHCISVDDYHKDSFHSVNLFLAESHTKKRTAEVLGDRGRNSKLAKASDACGDDIYLESSTTALTKWDDVLNKFSEETRDFLGPVVHELDHRGMNMMEDLLDYLRKTKNYEMLGVEMQSQSGTLLKKRSAETLSLLYKVAYEKAQLQLSSLKRERLQKMAQDLSSGIQDIQKLKRSYGENRYPPLAKDPKVGSDCHSCSANNLLKDEAVVGTLSSMRQEYEMLDEKTKSLVDLLYTRCNINGEERSNIDPTKPIKSYLKKKMQCRLVQQDLQTWRVANFESSLGSHNISLDYLGFICQRITVTGNPISSIVTNKLEDRRIEETFPNMNACSAFSYVFDEEATKKMSSSTRFADKTQITCFLLRNLLDVVVEVNAARLDIKELIKAGFHPLSGGRLDLLVSFVDFNSCQKVTISLDMTCLKRGIYPSEIIPHHVEVLKYGTPNNLLKQSLSTKIEGAGLKFGFQRIVRLCKCVAEVVRNSSS